jgi:hypothetical protein
MKSLRFLLSASVALVFLSACGEFAYKRGGQPAELAEVQGECRKSTGEGVSYENCMLSRGWTVQNLEQDPLVASTSANPDNRATLSQPETVVPTAPVPVTTGLTPLTPASSAVLTQSAAPVTPQDNPLQLLKINSMWKFGGTTSQLQDATASCVASLGESHRPVSGQQQLMTRGLVRCLRDKGWYGVATK